MANKVEIEAAARAAYRAAKVGPTQVGSWDNLPEDAKNEWRKVAGAALDAAERVQGILAEERTAA
jgi:hypothetical protein